jgi:hypothetical protein
LPLEDTWGDHNHVGPGIRQMTVGEMEYIMPRMTHTYKAGDYFFETGDISHRVINKSGMANAICPKFCTDSAGASLICRGTNRPRNRLVSSASVPEENDE